nr:hypothetical protein [Tanacetum cinerariifolium]
MFKNINGEAQIHAKVDGKKVIISKATIRKDLKFEDEGGVDCLSNEVIFEQLPLMGKPRRQDTQEIQPSGPTSNVEEEALNQKSVPTHSNDPLHSEDQEGFDDQEMFDTRVLDDEEVVIEKAVADKEVSAVKEIDDAQDQVSAATTTTVKDLTVDDITLAKALEALKTSKPKIREIIVRDHKESSETTTITTAVTIPTPTSTRPKARGVVMQEQSETSTITKISIPLKVQDKGKGIMEEEPLKMKKKDQINFDHQKAIRLQAEINEEERLAGERARLARMKAQQEKEANVDLKL